MGQLHKQVIDTPIKPSIYNPLRYVASYHWTIRLFVIVPLTALSILSCVLSAYIIGLGLTWIIYPSIIYVSTNTMKLFMVVLSDILLIYIIVKPTKVNVISFMLVVLLSRYMVKNMERYVT